MKTGTDGSVETEESTEGGMEIIKRRKEEINKGKKRLSAVRQVLKPPAHPALPSLQKSHPLPTPNPSLAEGGGSRHGRRMGWRREEKHSTHGWRLSY